MGLLKDAINKIKERSLEEKLNNLVIMKRYELDVELLSGEKFTTQPPLYYPKIKNFASWYIKHYDGIHTDKGFVPITSVKYVKDRVVERKLAYWDLRDLGLWGSTLKEIEENVKKYDVYIGKYSQYIDVEELLKI